MDAFLDLIRFDLWRDAALLWSGRLATALLVLVVGLWLARRLGKLVALAVERRGGDRVLANFLRSGVRIAIIVVVLVGALDLAGVPTGSLLAALGAAGLAIGLALKDSLGNLASGVLLVLQRPFRAGDYVDVGGQAGKVERIDLLRTVLITIDNREITIPNALVMNQPIVNFSARAERRLDLPVSVAYECDPVRALAVIRGVLDVHPRVLRDREPQLLVQRFAAGGVDLAVRPWVRTDDVLVAQSELLAAIKDALEREGIEIPFPQQVLHVRGEAAAALPLAGPPAPSAPSAPSAT
ncbi:MAG: mechanosensitive ion channel family protein [Xanthomonadaceae bacterium]|jgi:small-conductance mechanosensitive channel|nr:mechanosensitive ion channel family protein [Xanthomonadaceae bacterium]